GVVAAHPGEGPRTRGPAAVVPGRPRGHARLGRHPDGPRPLGPRPALGAARRRSRSEFAVTGMTTGSGGGGEVGSGHHLVAGPDRALHFPLVPAPVTVRAFGRTR